MVFCFVNSYGTDYKSLITKGDEYYKKFDLANAVLLYEEAYKLANENYEVLTRLARTYNDLGEDYYEIRDSENSEAAINKALKFGELLSSKYPDSAMTYALLAMSYGNLAMFKGGNEKIKLAHKIKENAEKSIRMNSDNYLPYIILSVYHRQIASLSWLEKIIDAPIIDFRDTYAKRKARKRLKELND